MLQTRVPYHGYAYYGYTYSGCTWHLHLLWLHLPSQMQAQQLAQLQSNVTARAHALNMAQMHGGTAAQQAQMHAEAQMQAQLQLQIQAQIRAQQQLQHSQHSQHGAPPHP